MKKKIVMFIAAVFAAAMIVPTQTQASPKYRTAIGIHRDYMCIVTKDRREWLLPDSQSKKNPYMKYNKKKRCYMPIFKNGQKVKVKFDTRGTKSKKDDRIVKVSICK